MPIEEIIKESMKYAVRKSMGYNEYFVDYEDYIEDFCGGADFADEPYRNKKHNRRED